MVELLWGRLTCGSRGRANAVRPLGPPGRTGSSTVARTHLHTSVVERKSGTAWLHLPSARSRIFNQSFPLPVSLRTSAHRTYCWAFQWGQFLKTCFRVCVLYGHHQHLAVDWFPVHFRYWPVRQCPVFSW
jgi:hypothetical protein